MPWSGKWASVDALDVRKLCLSLTQLKREIPIAAIEGNGIGDARSAADRVRRQGYRANDQISIFSAISIASSTSMPRYRTVLSIFECPNNSWTARRLPVRR